MIDIAVLHMSLPSDILESGGHIRVKTSSAKLRDFVERVTEAQGVKVLILELALLGEKPLEVIEKLERTTHAESTVVVYDFAKWKLLESLRKPGRHIIRAPISVRDLRATMLHLIVREISKRREATPDNAVAAGLIPATKPPLRKFSDDQLVRLQMVRSSIDCECPNQVANLVISLAGFENYSNNCENRSEADARMHNTLYRATGQARAIMEAALKELVEYEKIDPDQAPLNMDMLRAQVA